MQIFNRQRLGNSVTKKSRSLKRPFSILLILITVIVAYKIFDSGYFRSQVQVVPGEKVTGAPLENSAQLREIEHSVKRGETLDTIFSIVNLPQNERFKLLTALRKHIDPKRCHEGDLLTFSFSPDGSLEKFSYKASIADIYNAEKKSDQFVVTKEDIPIEVRTSIFNVTLDYSLYQAFIDAGESPLLVEKLVGLFAWDIDFFADPRKGDQITVIAEKLYANGEFYKYGDIDAAHYNGKIIDQQAYRYKLPDGKIAYFDEKGRSLARNFLKTPVKFTRISSRFGNRRHPVTHKLHKHLGTDYAAPTGTPVWSMADGVVTKKSYGNYNGRYIEIRHGKGYDTQYLHLSRYHPSIKVGKRIRQKEIIGYVGTTGRSTGPHLHLGIKRNGKHIDPLKIKKVKEQSLTGKGLIAFKTSIAPLVTEIDRGRRELIGSKNKMLIDSPSLDQIIDLDIFPEETPKTQDLARRGITEYQ